MSVVVVVKVSEGLVLGADSAATLVGRLQDTQGSIQEGVLKTFYNARKLLQVGDFPIGILTWGQAFIGPRTIESHIREWEHTNAWLSQSEHKTKHGDSFSVRECAEELLSHLKQAHEEEYSALPRDQRPPLGLVVAGYSEGEFIPEIFRFVLPFDDCLHNQRPDVDGKPDFGASWFGLTEPIIRLHFGRDDQVIRIISEKFGIAEEKVAEALQALQYPVPFAQMPLQDAIDYANYVLNVVIGRYRFVLGPDLCGGEIKIAAITQRDFSWISRKSWKLG